MNQQAIDILDTLILSWKELKEKCVIPDSECYTLDDMTEMLEEAKSRIQALWDGRTDEEIIFDIKSDIYSLQRKYNDFELSQAYDWIANFKLPPNK